MQELGINSSWQGGDVRGSWRETDTGQEWGGRDCWVKHPLLPELGSEMMLLQHTAQSGLQWCLQSRIPTGALPPGMGHAQFLPSCMVSPDCSECSLGIVNNITQRNNCSSHSVPLLIPHTNLCTVCIMMPLLQHMLCTSRNCCQKRKSHDIFWL